MSDGNKLSPAEFLAELKTDPEGGGSALSGGVLDALGDLELDLSDLSLDDLPSAAGEDGRG